MKYAEHPIDETTPTEHFIAWTVERFRNRRVVITTSFGMEGCALIDMYARLGAATTVIGWHRKALEMCGVGGVRIVEEECRAKGGAVCRYRVRWSAG